MTSVPTNSTPASRRLPRNLLLTLSLLVGLQPITTDLYLPALPALKADLRSPLSQVQLTLSATMLAFGLSQLVFGPLSDRFGRRPVLLGGLLAYTLSAIACALAGSIDELIAARIVQGASLGAGVMAARAIVRDLFAPGEGAKVMSRAMTGLGIIGCLSAPLGGLLTELGGWRLAFAAIGVAGAATLALIVLRYEETAPVPRAGSLAPRVLAATWLEILSHPGFRAWTLLTIAAYAGIFTFLAASSFVFIDVLGLSRLKYGMLLFTMSLFYIAGTIACRRALTRFAIRRVIAAASMLTAASGTTMGALWLLDASSPAAIIAPWFGYTFAHGFHMPCAQIGAVAAFPRAAGTASALNGCLMMLVAFAIGAWIGGRFDGTVDVLVIGVWAASLSVATAAWTVVRRHGAMG